MLSHLRWTPSKLPKSRRCATNVISTFISDCIVLFLSSNLTFPQNTFYIPPTLCFYPVTNMRLSGWFVPPTGCWQLHRNWLSNSPIVSTWKFRCSVPVYKGGGRVGGRGGWRPQHVVVLDSLFWLLMIKKRGSRSKADYISIYRIYICIVYSYYHYISVLHSTYSGDEREGSDRNWRHEGGVTILPSFLHPPHPPPSPSP